MVSPRWRGIAEYERRRAVAISSAHPRPPEPCARDGRPSALCTRYSFIGSRRQGALAEYVVVPTPNVLPLPDSVSLRDAALVEPLSMALHEIVLARYDDVETGRSKPPGIRPPQCRRCRTAPSTVPKDRGHDHTRSDLDRGSCPDFGGSVDSVSGAGRPVAHSLERAPRTPSFCSEPRSGNFSVTVRECAHQPFPGHP